MSYTLYTYPGNPRAFKALIAAQYVGIDINVPPFVMGKDNKTPEFLQDVNPLGKVPALSTPSGGLWESNAIARYVARQNDNKAGLYGKCAYNASLIDQWLDFATNELNLAVSAWIYPIFEYMPHNQAMTDKAKADVAKALTTLNNHLLSHTFLVGERISLADIVVACELYLPFTMTMDAKFREPFGNVVRWYQTLVHQPQFQAVLGAPVICEVARFAGDGKKMVEAPKEEKKADKPKEEKKAKEDKPKEEKKEKKPKEEKPKEEKPKEEPKPKVAEEAEEDDDTPKEPKKKSALDLLPPSPFILDEFKRLYSNASSTRSIFPELWSKFDAEGWSWWFAEYKYNDECEKLFMTCNLVGGWVQRLDALRKYGFGNILIFGKEPKLVVRSSWLFRGQDVPQEMKESEDCEHYVWRKADITNAADKALIEDFMAWEGKFGGSEEIEAEDGKTFK